MTGRPHHAFTDIDEDQLNNDTANIVTVHRGMVHISRDTPEGSQVPVGDFPTQQESSPDHLRSEGQWGKKKFAPRTEVVRDTGVIYHVVGPHVVWPRGVECQVQEGDVGDIFTVRGAQITTTIDPNLKAQATPVIKSLSPEKGGVPHTQGAKAVSRMIKSETTEVDGWNTVEVIVRGQASFEHIVNGVTSSAGTDIQQLAEDEETWLPLGKGKRLFQAEGVEVFDRNIEIKVLRDSLSSAWLAGNRSQAGRLLRGRFGVRHHFRPSCPLCRRPHPAENGA